MASTRDLAYKFVMEHRWFHGTSYENAIRILEGGFDVSKQTGEAAIGFGAYFTNSVDDALEYARRFSKGAVIEVTFPKELFVVDEIDDITGTFGTIDSHAEMEVENLNVMKFDEIVSDCRLEAILVGKYGSVREARKKFLSEDLFYVEDIVDTEYMKETYRNYIGDRTQENIDEGIQVGIRGSQIAVYDDRLLERVSCRMHCVVEKGKCVVEA